MMLGFLSSINNIFCNNVKQYKDKNKSFAETAATNLATQLVCETLVCIQISMLRVYTARLVKKNCKVTQGRQQSIDSSCRINILHKSPNVSTEIGQCISLRAHTAIETQPTPLICAGPRSALHLTGSFVYTASIFTRLHQQAKGPNKR